jgi:hypothetical protein
MHNLTTVRRIRRVLTEHLSRLYGVLHKTIPHAASNKQTNTSILHQGCTNPEGQVAVATKFCTLAPPLSVYPQFGTALTSLYWGFEFWDGSWSVATSVHPCCSPRFLSPRSCLFQLALSNTHYYMAADTLNCPNGTLAPPEHTTHDTDPTYGQIVPHLMALILRPKPPPSPTYSRA